MSFVDLLLRRPARRIRLAARSTSDRLRLARQAPTPGSHQDMHVHRILLQLTGKRQERLGVDHRINSCLVDLTCAGAFLNQDQLGPALGNSLNRTFTVSLFGARRSPRIWRAQLRLIG